MALMAIASLAQTGFGIYSQQQQIRAANRATKKSVKEGVRNRNDLLRQRSQMGGTVLGGSSSDKAAANSEQGTILTGTNQNRSLLG